MIWFTADTHFGHKNIIKYCDRPFQSVEEMNHSLIENWNQSVDYTDTVYFLGDLCFGNQNDTIEVIRSLNGFKHIVFGNHDRTLRKVLREQPLVESEQDYLEVTIGRQHIVMCHYAMRVWNRAHHGTWMLYGHSHGTLPGIGKSMDVGVDTNNYKPYSFEEIKEIMSEN